MNSVKHSHLFDMFGPGSNVEHRYIPDHNRLKEIIDSVRQMRADLPVVMTLGSYDLLHIGHARYLEQAKKHGAVTVVGLDCDAGIKLRKGDRRPIQPEQERIEMLCHLRHVDLITLDTDYVKEGPRAGHTQFSLVKLLQPDIFIASERSYDDEQQRIIKENCTTPEGMIMLKSQAETSTSAQLRIFVLEVGDVAKEAIDQRLEKEVPEELKKSFIGKNLCELINSLGDVAKEAIDQRLEELKP